MTVRGYGQFCGLARALELVGERWALLIVRDLLVGPRRFTDLRQGLPRIPTNVLADRLKELEHSGIVQRKVLPRPAASVVYELTPYGSQLEEVVMRLGLWGAQSLGEPRADEIVTADSMVMALRSTFVPRAAERLTATFELHLGPVVLSARVERGKLTVTEGSATNPDLVLEAGPGIKDLLNGELSPRDALCDGRVRVIEGDPKLLERFVKVFRIPARPAVPA